MSAPHRVTIARPDDWHAHLRDGDMLRAVLPYTARVFGRALVMPNLVPPVRTAADAEAYRGRIAACLPSGSGFTPRMACYLTDSTQARDLVQGFRRGALAVAKLYPAGATTNSDLGVTALSRITGVLEAMQEARMPLSVHGEVTDPDVDVFDREAVFVDRVLEPLRRDFPGLRIVLEHVSSAHGADYVLAARDNLAATVTPHHLVLTRSDLFRGGINPHHFCLPVAKSFADREAVRRAAASGDERFFLGTDTAPHPVAAKERERGAGGIFCAPGALELVAQVFEDMDALDRLEAFASLNGARFYGLEPNADAITLVRRGEPLDLPEAVPAGGDRVRVFRPRDVFWEIGEGLRPA